MQMAEELGMLGLGVPDGWMARRPSSGRLVRSCGLLSKVHPLRWFRFVRNSAAGLGLKKGLSSSFPW